MKPGEMITRVDGVVDNIYPMQSKLDWINDLEQKTFNNIMKDSEGPIKKNIENMDSEDLFLPSQFLDLYEYYLTFKIHLHNNEFAKANNFIALYNAVMDDLKKWYYEEKVKEMKENPSDPWG